MKITTYIIYTIHNAKREEKKNVLANKLPEVAVQLFDDEALKFMQVKYFLIQGDFCHTISECTYQHIHIDISGGG